MYVIYSALTVGLPEADILTLSAQHGDYVSVLFCGLCVLNC